MPCENCGCETCTKVNVPEHTRRPFRCRGCDSVNYLRIHPGLLEDVKPKCQVCCTEFCDFCGYTDEELGFHSWHSERYLRLQEGHNWEGYGMYNPHAVPLRGTPAWDKYMAEGRIKRDPRTGMEALYSKDYNEYKRTIKDLGMQNVYGDGEISKSRQRGEHYREG